MFLETELPVDLHPKLALLLSAVPQRARVLSYMDLRELWTAKYFPYEQIPINRSPHNRFVASPTLPSEGSE